VRARATIYPSPRAAEVLGQLRAQSRSRVVSALLARYGREVDAAIEAVRASGLDPAWVWDARGGAAILGAGPDVQAALATLAEAKAMGDEWIRRC